MSLLSRLRPLLILAVAAVAFSACDAPSEPVPGATLPPVEAPQASDPTAPGSADASEPPTGAPTTAPTPTPSETASATSPSAPTSVPTYGGTASDAPEAVGAPSTYPEAQARVDALLGGSVQQLRRFSTPGDEIYCLLGDPVLGTACELRRATIRDSQVCAGAQGDAVGRVELTDAGAVPQCNTDTIREPGARTVQPAAVIGGGEVTCAVERIGVTCIDRSRKTGFFLAPGRYATFG